MQHATTLDEVLALRSEKADLQKRYDKLMAWALRAKTALIKVRPLGGSELFMFVNGECLADPEWCGAAIEDLRNSLHEARKENVRLQKSAPAKPEGELTEDNLKICRDQLRR